MGLLSRFTPDPIEEKMRGLFNFIANPLDTTNKFYVNNVLPEAKRPINRFNPSPEQKQQLQNVMSSPYPQVDPAPQQPASIPERAMMNSPQVQQQPKQKKMRQFKSAAGNEYQVEDNDTYNNANIKQLVEKYFPRDQVDNALRVMAGESGGEWWKIGDDYIIPGDISEQMGKPLPSYGLFQIRSFPERPNKDTLMDPEQNVKYAAKLYKDRGWGQWTVARNLGLD